MTVIAIACSAALSSCMCPAGSGELTIFPCTSERAVTLSPADNKNGIKAFTTAIQGDLITVNFKKEPQQDNYIHIDLGPAGFAKYIPGGYVSVEMNIDNPVMLTAMALADPKDFWADRIPVEAECPVKPGLNEYRFYLANISDYIEKNDKLHLFLFLRDNRKQEPANATVTVKRIVLHPQTANWQDEMDRFYAGQYNRLELKNLNGIYRASYENLVPWDGIKANPSSTMQSLNGAWRKNFAGDLTWNYEALKDDSWAKPGFDDSKWKEVNVPEPQTPDQKGGHYIYRKKFKFDAKAPAKTYLRFDDISQYAEIYVNGRKVSCQSGAERGVSWLVEGASLKKQDFGKSAKELFFERCGTGFDKNAVPGNDKALLLPRYLGEAYWPFAMDVSNFLVDGENTIAIRLYGCPIKGFWIFGNRPEDRSFNHVFGIPGDVRLLVNSMPAIAQLESTTGSVGAGGLYSRNFTCRLDAAASKSVDSLALSVDNSLPVRMKPGDNGCFAAAVTLRADFKTHMATVSALDSTGRVLDSRGLSFIGSVFEVRDRVLFVNGDRFFIRGVNSAAGVEMDGNWSTTRKEWLRQLRFYSGLGFNAVRGISPTRQSAADALNAGLMVLPVAVPGSCNSSLLAFGDLKNPDLDFITDLHREMAIFLSSQPNVLMWNIGNEISHTPSWNDKEIVQRFIDKAGAAVAAFDPAGRAATFSNLECYDKPLCGDPKGWFFTGGQGVIGMNIYSEVDRFRKEAADFDRIFDRPYVITEWGLSFDFVRATKDRNDNIDAWERRMTEKWNLTKTLKSCAGIFLFPHHGEFKDTRGKAFIQKLMQPFEVKMAGKQLSFTNRDVCPMRDLDIVIATDSDVLCPGLHVAELKPGETATLTTKTDLPAASGLHAEINYETHRGLKHSFIRNIQAAKQ